MFSVLRITPEVFPVLRALKIQSMYVADDNIFYHIFIYMGNDQ